MGNDTWTNNLELFKSIALCLMPLYLNPVNNLKTVFAILSMLQAVIAVIGGRCIHFNSSFGTSPLPPTFFQSWKNVNNSALSLSQTDGHILQTTVPKPLVTVAGLGGEHMPLFLYTGWEKKFLWGLALLTQQDVWAAIFPLSRGKPISQTTSYTEGQSSR